MNTKQTSQEADELEVDFLGIEDVTEGGSSHEELEDTDIQVDDTTNLTDEDKKDNVEPDEADTDTTTDETVDESSEETPLTVELMTQLGYEFEDEFEDSVEGITQLTRKAAEKMANDQLDLIFNQYPEVRELFEYRQMGGDPDKFIQTKFPELDYTQIELTEDERQHEQLVRAELQTKGYSPEEIQAELEDYKAGGILENKAKRALEGLKKYQVAQKEQLLQQQQQQYEQEQREIEQFWDSINGTITKANQLKGFTLPESDKKSFFDYISKPVKDGLSQRDLDLEASDMETRLALDYLMYKKLNLSELVTKKANTQRAKSLRDRLKRGNVSSTPTKRIGSVEELADI